MTLIMQNVSYDEVDFNESNEIDPIAIRDAEDQYFDEEEPSEDGSHREGGLRVNGDCPAQNGPGEYDY